MHSVDCAHVAQVQLQMHATNTPCAYIASYARGGLRIFKVRYSQTFIQAAAAMLREVLEAFGPEDAALPVGDITHASCPEAVRDAWYPAMRQLVASAQRCSEVQLTGSRFWTRRCSTNVVRR